MSSLGYIKCMSKEVLIEGEIIKGRKLGTKLGFPTVNIKYRGDLSGVFVGEISLNNMWVRSVIHVGEKSTIDDMNKSIEVHILDWEEKMNQYIMSGDKVKVKFLFKIRETEKFDTLDDLKIGIFHDVEFAKNWYNHC